MIACLCRAAVLLLYVALRRGLSSSFAQGEGERRVDEGLRCVAEGAQMVVACASHDAYMFTSSSESYHSCFVVEFIAGTSSSAFFMHDTIRHFTCCAVDSEYIYS